MSFAGIPSAAFDFYDDLEGDNTKAFWDAHKTTYEKAVKAPMTALTAALEGEFGPAKVFDHIETCDSPRTRRRTRPTRVFSSPRVRPPVGMPK